MGANIPGTLLIMLATVFFLIVALGVALGAYAATQMKKLEEKCK